MIREGLSGWLGGLRRRRTGGTAPGRHLFGRDLAAKSTAEVEIAARAILGSGLEARLARYIDWLQGEGYEFHAFDARPPRLDQSRVYLRYDAQPADLAACWLIAGLHQRLRVPATLGLGWAAIRAKRLDQEFLRLREFDAGFVGIGLQASPVADWMTEERFGGDPAALARFVRSAAFVEFLERLLAAWREAGMDAPELAAIRDGGRRRFVATAAAFRAAFGPGPAISGRGSALSDAFARERRRRPALAALDDLFHPSRFLQGLDLAAHGFGPETNSAPPDDLLGPHLMHGGGDVEKLRAAHHERIWGRGGFVAMFPAAAWAGPRYDDLTLPPPLPEPPVRSHGRSPPPLPSAPVLTNLIDLVPFGRRCERLEKSALAAAARARLGDGVERTLVPFVAWLRDNGYAFGDFEHGAPRFGERVAYLRYDVHIQDLLAAYALADLHERLEIPGSFQISWRVSPAEEALEPFFLKLAEFDRRYVQFGLHCAPTATWFIHDRCGGDHRRAREAVREPAFEAWLATLAAAHARAGDEAPELCQLRQRTEERLADLAASFRAAFGAWKSVSGHGNFLTNEVNRMRERIPGLLELDAYFNPVQFMRRFGVGRFGFDHEVTAFQNDHASFPPVICEGNPPATLRRWYHGRVSCGLGFIGMFHPATLTCDQLAELAVPPSPSPEPRRHGGDHLQDSHVACEEEASPMPAASGEEMTESRRAPREPG